MCSCLATSISPETCQKHDNFKKTNAGGISAAVSEWETLERQRKESAKKKKQHVFESLFLALKTTNYSNMTESCITQKIQACMTLSNVDIAFD